MNAFQTMGWGLALWGCTMSASAQGHGVYRCTAADGRVAYSDAPCPRDARTERVDVVPNSLDNAGERERQLARENARLKEQLREQEQAPTAVPAVPTADRGQRIDSFECQKARRDYEVTANAQSSREQVVEAKRSAMYAICGIREPDRTDVRIQNEINVAPGPHGQ